MHNTCGRGLLGDMEITGRFERAVGSLDCQSSEAPVADVDAIAGLKRAGHDMHNTPGRGPLGDMEITGRYERAVFSLDRYGRESRRPDIEAGFAREFSAVFDFDLRIAFPVLRYIGFADSQLHLSSVDRQSVVLAAFRRAIAHDELARRHLSTSDIHNAVAVVRKCRTYRQFIDDIERTACHVENCTKVACSILDKISRIIQRDAVSNPQLLGRKRLADRERGWRLAVYREKVAVCWIAACKLRVPLSSIGNGLSALRRIPQALRLVNEYRLRAYELGLHPVGVVPVVTSIRIDYKVYFLDSGQIDCLAVVCDLFKGNGIRLPLHNAGRGDEGVVVEVYHFENHSVGTRDAIFKLLVIKTALRLEANALAVEIDDVVAFRMSADACRILDPIHGQRIAARRLVLPHLVAALRHRGKVEILQMIGDVFRRCALRKQGDGGRESNRHEHILHCDVPFVCGAILPFCPEKGISLKGVASPPLTSAPENCNLVSCMLPPF